MRDRLLTPLRSVVRDLIDKRLWPVALLLVAALVAVPVVIGASASDAPVPAATPVATPAAGSAPKSAITVADEDVVERSRPGAVSDPFFDPPEPDTATGGGTSTATAPGSAGSTPSAGSGSSTTNPSTTTSTSTSTGTSTVPGSTPAPSTTATPEPTTDDRAERTLYRTRLSFGAGDGAEVRGVSRLEPLGGRSNPAVQYLGTTRSGRSAVFLLGPGAVSEGDAECAETTCRVIALKPGDRQVVEVTDEQGSIRRYALEIDDVVREIADSVGEADRLRARVDADGREVLRAMILDRPTANAIGQFAYDRSTGAVVARSDD